MSTNDPILCVDFGTTTTQAALVNARGVQDFAENPLGPPTGRSGKGRRRNR